MIVLLWIGFIVTVALPLAFMVWILFLEAPLMRFIARRRRSVRKAQYFKHGAW